MANDKKFIVKNGLLSPTGAIVVGSTSFNSTDELQVTGSSLFTGSASFTQSNASLATMQIFNTGGHAANSIIAEFRGDSDSLQLVNFGSGDYELTNSGQNNGIRFYDDTDGVEIVYNGATDLEFSSTGIDFKREPQYLGNVFWNAGNDGAGSGLDADLLDGLDSLQFLRADEDDTMDGSLTITGNLTVQGVTTYINTEEILLSDNIITLNANYTGSTPTENAGIEVERGTLTNPALVWNETSDYWQIETNGTPLGRIITTADEGSGNGFDADTVDGLEAAQFLRSDANDTGTGNYIFQGTLTLGNNTAAGAQLIMDGQNVNRSLYSSLGEIGFLNSSLNYAARSDTNDDWIVGRNVVAEQFVDADNASYYVEPAATSHINDIELYGQIIADGDADTFINFNAADSLEVRTGNSQRLVVNNNGVTAVNAMYSPTYYDNDNQAYYGDFAATSVMNRVGIDDRLLHNGDTDTYLEFTDNQITLTAGGNTVFTTTASAVTVGTDLVAPRFVDANDTAYFTNPAGISEMQRIDLDDFIRHRGNTTSYFGFSADNVFKIYTGGGERVNIDSDSADFTQNVYAPAYYDSDNNSYYANFGDTGVSLSFAGQARGASGTAALPTYSFGSDTNTGLYTPGADRVGISTNGALRLDVRNTYVDVTPSGGIRASYFYDRDNTTYYANPADDSVFHSLGLDDYLFHNGDTNSYLGWSAPDNFSIYSNGIEAVNINDDGHVGIGTNSHIYQFEVNTGTSDYIRLTSTDQRIGIILDQGGSFATGYMLADDDMLSLGSLSTKATSNLNISLASATRGNVGIGDNAPAARLSVRTTGQMGSNPFADANRLINFGEAAQVDFSIRGSSQQHAYFISDQDKDWYFYDSGASGKFAILNSGDVIVNNDSATNASHDNATLVTGAVNGNKLHVDGSVIVNGAADGFVVGTSNSTILTQDELAFGSGSGLYMDNASYLKVSNSVKFQANNDIEATRFVDKDDTTYYLDPANTDVALKIAGEVLGGNGQLGSPTYSFVSDTNTGMYRKAADTIGFSAGGNEEMNIYTTYVDVINELRTHKLVDRANTSYTFEPQGVANGWRLSTPSGYIDFGPMNTSWAHIQTDRDKFYFNKGITVDTGEVHSYNEDLNLRRAGSAGNRIQIASGRTYSHQTFQVTGGTANAAGANTPTKLEINSAPSNATSPGDMYGQLQFKVTGASGVSASGISGTDADTVAMITAEDFRTGTGKTNEDSGIGFYTTASTGALQYNGGVSSTGAWYVGNLRGTDNRGRLYVQNEAYATRYYDRNNTAYYTDQAGTSLHNVQRANQYQIDGSTYIIDSPSGDYGSIRVGGAKGGWAGYAIQDDWVFMSDGNVNAGIYNDTRNEWMTRWYDNAQTEIMYNGTKQAETGNGYLLANNQMRAPIYYDSADTAYWGDFASDSRMKSISVGDQARISTDSTYPFKIHHANRYLAAFKNSAADANYPWLVHDDRNNRSNFIVHFNSIGDRFWFEENGDFQAYGTGRFANIALNGGNEDLSLLKSYGSGKADTVIFDGTEYWEKRVIQVMQGAEDSATTSTADFVKNNDGPFEASYALRTSGYRTFDSDYIAVEPGMEIYGEISARLVSGSDSGGTRYLYMGVRRYDKDKNPIAGNDGITYFVASAANVTSTGWTTYKAHHTIPTSHSPFNGSDGGGCKYIRVIVLMNYAGSGAVREFGPPIVRRTNYLSNIDAQEARFSGNLYAPIFYDSNDNNFYVNPASTSKMNTVDASNFRDRDNTARYMNPATGGSVEGSWNWNNGTIDNLNDIAFNDPGPNEGIRWKGGTDWRIYESPDDLTTNSGGNLQFTATTGGAQQYQFRATNGGSLQARGDMRAPIFYDINNTSYYINPNSTGEAMRLAGRVRLDNNGTEVWMDMLGDANNEGRMRFMNYNGDVGIEFSDLTGGSSTGDSSFMFGMDDKFTGNMFLRFNSGSLFGADFTSSGTELMTWMYNGRVGINATSPSYTFHVGGEAYASSNMRSPIYYDSNNTSYYGNFASESRMSNIRLYSSNSLYFNTGTSTANFRSQTTGGPVTFDMIQDTGTNSNSVDYGVLRLARANHDNSSSSVGAGFYFRLKDNGGTYREYAGISGNKTTSGASGGKLRFMHYGRTLMGEMDSAQFYHNASVRAPIFYDTNDTNYYLDPASTSNLNTVQAADAFRSDRYEELGGGFLLRDGSSTGPGRHLNLWDSTSDPSQADGGVTGISWGQRSDSQPYYMIYVDKENYGGDYSKLRLNWHTGIQIGANKSYGGTRFYNDSRRDAGGGSEIFSVGKGDDNVRVENILFADSMYDNDNTSYYVDPAGTSNLNGLTVGGYSQNQPWTGRWYNTSTYVYDSTNGTRYYWIRVGRTNTGGAKGILEYYAKDDVNYSGFVKGTVVVSSWNNSTMSVGHQTNYPNDSITPEVRIDNNRYLWLRMNGCTWDSQLWWRWIRQDGITTNDGSTKVEPGSPADSTNTILSGQGFRGTLGSVAGGSPYNMRSYFGNITAQGDVRGTVFYDQSNTSYFFDGNSTSRMNGTNVDYRYRPGHSRGHLVGSYNNIGANSTKTNPIYTIGSNYNPTDGNLENMYGIGYSHPNANYDGINSVLGGWGLYVAADGDARVGLDGSNGRVYATGAAYIPIYYDKNDTNYYGDFAGTTRLNVLRFNSVTGSGGSATQGVSAVGQFGQWYNHNTYTDFNAAVNHWGWSYVQGNTNAPNTGSSQWYRVRTSLGQEYGLNYGSSDYWLEVAYPRSNYTGSVGSAWMRTCEAGSVNGWEQIGSYIRGTGQASSDYRAPIFYDSNDTNYYINPNGNSNISTMDFDRLVGPANSTRDKIRVYSSSSYAIGMQSDVTFGALNDWAMTFQFNDEDDRGFWWGDTGHTTAQGAMSLTTNGDLTVARRISSGFGGSTTSGPAYTLDINGTSYLRGSVYGDIYYDRNDSGYYADPASTTKLNELSLNGKISFVDTGGSYTYEGYIFYGDRTTRGTPNTNSTVYNYGLDGYGLILQTGYSSDVGFIKITDDGVMVGGAADENVFVVWDEDAQSTRFYVDNSGNSQSYTSMRAPIFYDRNNTFYYTNPAGTSRMNSLDIRGNIDNDGWYRNDSDGRGLRNDANGTDFYATNSQEWRMTGNNNDSAMNLRGLATFDGRSRFWIHGEGDSSSDSLWQGFLNSGGEWMFRMTHRDGYSPGMRFNEPDVQWTGDPGNDRGKIEYHSDRFYIVGGGNSNRICQFRRDGSDKAHVDNDGVYNGTATSARWADLAERYSADDIYEPGTLMGIDLDGDAEITVWREGLPMVGVISTEPGVRMNDMGIENDKSKKAKMNPFIALKGRIPAFVSGDVKKGMWLIPDPEAVGKCKGVPYGTPGINSHEIIGIALSNSENGIVEVKV